MLGAPAVTHPTGRTPLLAALLLGAWLLGGAGALWVLGGPSGAPVTSWKAVPLAGTLLLAAIGLLGLWRSQPPRVLAWDGAQWRVRPAGALSLDGPALDLQVRLDLQSALLLRAQDVDSGRDFWLWAQDRSDSARWHLLRCALFSGGVPDPAPAGRGDGARA